MDNKRPTWAEIDLTAIRNNLRCIKEALSPGTKIMTSVKANAYGHGVKEISRVCLEEMVDFLAVATLDEALELRDEGITAPVMILGYVPGQYADLIVRHHIRTAVYDASLARELSKAAQIQGKTAHIHIKIDTGMGRIGFAPDSDTIGIIENIVDLPGIEVEGIFTHFTEADHENDQFTREQFKAFQDYIRELEQRGISIPLKHCSNSAAIFRYPETHLDMVRVGIVLYGLYPSQFMKSMDLGILPAMTLKSRVGMVKNLSEGHGVSYGRTHICDRETRVATLPIGYADGYSRIFSNRAWVMIKGQRANSLGVVCMDQSIDRKSVV